MDPLQTRLDALDAQLHTLQQQTHATARRLRWWRGLACALVALAALTWALPVVTADHRPHDDWRDLPARVAALEDLLKHVSRDGNDLTITGANLRLVNGLGSTGCGGFGEEPIPDCPNGLGNLIVGYNELRLEQDEENFRTGSHNVVVGFGHNFSRVGGLMVGGFSTLSGDFAVVNGLGNMASGLGSSVYGGQGNTASGFAAAVCGGNLNTASGEFAVVSGGAGNTASGFAAAVCGGGFNPVTLEEPGNTASGFAAVVCGGQGNVASGEFAVVSGGRNRTAEGEFDWVAGSLVEDE